MGRQVGPLDMAAETILSVGKTSLGSSFPRADVPAGKKEVAVSARDAPDGPATVVVLTLLKERPTNTGHTPDAPARDIGALGPPGDVPVFVAPSRPVRLKTPAPEEARVMEVGGDEPVRTATAGPDTGGAGSAVVQQAATPGRALRAEPRRFRVVTGVVDIEPTRLLARRETSISGQLRPIGSEPSIPVKARVVTRVGATVVPSPDLTPIPRASATAAAVAPARPMGPFPTCSPSKDMAADGVPLRRNFYSRYQRHFLTGEKFST